MIYILNDKIYINLKPSKCKFEMQTLLLLLFKYSEVNALE